MDLGNNCGLFKIKIKNQEKETSIHKEQGWNTCKSWNEVEGAEGHPFKAKDAQEGGRQHSKARLWFAEGREGTASVRFRGSTSL